MDNKISLGTDYMITSLFNGTNNYKAYLESAVNFCIEQNAQFDKNTLDFIKCSYDIKIPSSSLNITVDNKTYDYLIKMKNYLGINIKKCVVLVLHYYNTNFIPCNNIEDGNLFKYIDKEIENGRGKEIIKYILDRI